MVPPPSEPLAPEIQHNLLKSAFLYSPLGDADQELVSKLSKETGLDNVNIEKWFKTMRRRLKIGKFVGLKEDCPDTEEPSYDIDTHDGKSPLDCIISVGDKPKESGVGDATYRDDTSNIVEDELSASLNEESNDTVENPEAEKDTNMEKETNAEDSVVEIKQEVLEPSQIKSEPIDLPIKPKQEMLTTEEKAEKYDKLRAEMERLQRQMEEMKRRFETPSVAEPTIMLPV